jgi:hypothetical protein
MIMRTFLVLLASTSLAACGGAGVQTAGSAAPPTGSTGGGTTTGNGTPTPSSAHTFAAPTEVKSYNAIGGVQSYQYKTDNIDGNPATPEIDASSVQYGQLYAGNASTARNSGISITYNPRDAIFEMTVTEPLGNVSSTTRFQDPVHRTNYGGARGPQDGNVDITSKGVRYLEVGSGSGPLVYDTSVSTTFPIAAKDAKTESTTFFYQLPGTTTKYVTYAGFVRNGVSIAEVTNGSGGKNLENSFKLERGAFVFGERTASAAVPKVGSGTFNGQMIATLVFNNLLDTDASTPTYFQWMDGTSSTVVDFAANTFTIALAGTVSSPLFDTYTSKVFSLQSGATFSAAGKGRIDLINAGGFLGNFQTASFVQPNGTVLALNIAGSSVDGTFFGPAAEEVGGGFRIVGGTPDERIDILGAFTGKK